jgi:hypothetical protein
MLRFERTRVWACLFVLLVQGLGRAETRGDINKRLLDAIAEIRKIKTPVARYKAAEKLAAITDEKDCSAVNDKTIRALISLLDIDDDGVRMWAASALGDIGPRARAAAPKLIRILSVSDCMTWDHSSAATIPIALKRMGVEPPSRHCSR